MISIPTLYTVDVSILLIAGTFYSDGSDIF